VPEVADRRVGKAVEPSPVPASWHALPEELRKPYWSVAEAARATGLSRSTLYRMWADPKCKFPKPRSDSRRQLVPAIAVLRHLDRGA
jgi:hypothetical protein